MIISGFKNYKRQLESVEKEKEHQATFSEDVTMETSFLLKSPKKIKISDESWLQNKFDEDFQSGQWINALQSQDLLGNLG
jgi:hypothetical protein